MMDNQAFGWLKKSIMGGAGGGDSSSSGIDEDIANCSNPSILVNGVAHDFKMLLLLSNTSDSTTDISVPPPDTKLSISSAAVASEGSSAAAIVDATQSSKLSTSDGAPSSTPTNNHSDNLTARLDRIKTLLYEERSASSNSVTQNGGIINLNWVPAIATGVFKSFTQSESTSDEVANDNTTSDMVSSSSAAVAVSDYEKLNTNELIPTILQNLPLLQFEARKSISAIFNYLLVCGIDGNDAQCFISVSTAFAKYVLDRGEVIIGQLVNVHDCSEVVINKNGMSGSGMKGSILEKAASAASSNGGDGGGSCVDITLLCGSMLRSSIRHANIYQYILSNEHCVNLVYPFLDIYVHNPNFDVSSDALETVRVMLSGMPGGSNQQAVAAAGMVGDTASEEYKQLMESIASDFLNRKYTEIIDERINKKCLSSTASYMTRRMSLQVLSTILLNRVNYNVMMMYISSSKNLVIILCLLRDPSPHITLDAFQVFKIFVANPNKPPEVIKILFDNKVKLVKYLEGLHKERENNDDQYRDEKQLVISTLEALEI